ncbi:MAG: alanine racemase, partial [Clostridia bacterium]|nr:alanine racemase [Clostridia bacterium]
MNHPVPRNIRIMDSGAITGNMRLIRSIVPDTAKIMAVIKADGYGHGALTAARASLAGGADMLAVATTDEGSLLRKAGITTPIL